MSTILVILYVVAGLVALLVAISLMVVVYRKVTSPHGIVGRFFASGEDGLTAEDRVRITNNHPGAGGFG